ncbi:MAG: Ig-like domain-containing protein, partial [Prolixibacteraceae bacterium]|nr:Ig-like domain-containing protein [Prolixibacteraceae bacterium]
MTRLIFTITATILFFTFCKNGDAATEEISLNIISDTIDINCTLQLKATLTPEDSEKSIVWKSSDVSVATVNDNGLVTGIKGGLATIAASANNGSLKAECIVLVIGKGSLSSIMEKGFLKTTSHNNGVDLAVDTSGIPYLAFVAYDPVLNDESRASCEVWKYSSETQWTQFGERVAVTDNEAYAPGIAIDHDNKVYVSHLYFENENDDRFNSNVVAHSTSEGWTYLGEGKKSLIEDGGTALFKGSEIAFKK